MSIHEHLTRQLFTHVRQIWTFDHKRTTRNYVKHPPPNPFIQGNITRLMFGDSFFLQNWKWMEIHNAFGVKYYDLHIVATNKTKCCWKIIQNFAVSCEYTSGGRVQKSEDFKSRSSLCNRNGRKVKEETGEKRKTKVERLKGGCFLLQKWVINGCAHPEQFLTARLLALPTPLRCLSVLLSSSFSSLGVSWRTLKITEKRKSYFPSAQVADWHLSFLFCDPCTKAEFSTNKKTCVDNPFCSKPQLSAPTKSMSQVSFVAQMDKSICHWLEHVKLSLSLCHSSSCRI